MCSTAIYLGDHRILLDKSFIRLYNTYICNTLNLHNNICKYIIAPYIRYGIVFVICYITHFTCPPG